MNIFFYRDNEDISNTIKNEEKKIQKKLQKTFEEIIEPFRSELQQETGSVKIHYIDDQLENASIEIDGFGVNGQMKMRLALNQFRISKKLNDQQSY